MMKRLISSLVVAMMLFCTVVSITCASTPFDIAVNTCIEFGYVPEKIDDAYFALLRQGYPLDDRYGLTDGSVSLKRKKRDLNDFLCDETTLSFEDFKKVLIDYEFSIESIRAVTLKIFKYRKLVNDIDIINIVFYLIHEGVSFTEINGDSSIHDIYENICLSMPSNLNTDDGRKKAMDAIAGFCEKFGIACILATGDIISNNGKIYNSNGEEYYVDGVTARGDSYVKKEHWDNKDFALNLEEIKGDTVIESDLESYGLFILPNKLGFNCCFYGTEENRFIKLDGVSYISRYGREKIELSESGDITLPNGSVIRYETKDVDYVSDFVEWILKKSLSQVVFDLVRHGEATKYVEYMMKYLVYIDDRINKQIYKNEESLKEFVLNNFCCTSLNIAIECLEKGV